MVVRDGSGEDEEAGFGVNPGYAFSQLSKALRTSKKSNHESARERALAKVEEWQSVIANLSSGAVDYGSRMPVKDTPAWATLEVVTGGSAAGSLLAGGPLQEHEKAQLEVLADQVPEGAGRRALNLLHLTDKGLADLRERLRTGRFELVLPEEGGLPVVAWLLEHDHVDLASHLLEELEPYFDELRFFPIPHSRARRGGSRVFLQDVGTTIGLLEAITPNQNILAQRESTEIWGPFNDRVVGLFLETVQGDWPCQDYPKGWSRRALALLDDYSALRATHAHCGRPERTKGHAAQLREFLARCARDPSSLTAREVGRVREMLRRHCAKYGEPQTDQCAAIRKRRQAEVAAPLFSEIAAVVIDRLGGYARGDGLDDVSALGQCVRADEATRHGVPAGTEIPKTIQTKARRCYSGSIEELMEFGLILSADKFAAVLPRVTSELQAAGIEDPTLRRLYAVIYRAFRKRRSLSLLDLQSPTQIGELPWVAVMDRFRDDKLPSQELARQVLEEVATLAITSFPQAIIPNQLLKEFRTLAKSANLDIPFVDELASNSYVEEFSRECPKAARRAGDLLRGTLYARYYMVDFDKLSGSVVKKLVLRWLRRLCGAEEFVREPFAQLCFDRAGVWAGTRVPITSGMIIEQQQILTTQNLAALFSQFGLTESLQPQLPELAQRCFTWLCKRLQVRPSDRPSSLIALKKTAYAWRQMVFFLSFLPDSGVADFLAWARRQLAQESEAFQSRFLPALEGLALAAGERGGSASATPARPFLGWSKERHWLMPEQPS